MIDTVLIDFDGTLMDTRSGIINSWKHAFKLVFGREVKEEFLKDTFGEPLKVSLKKMFSHIPLEESLEIYRDYQKNHEKEMMTPFAGMVEMLKKLNGNGYKVALVTSRGAVSTKQGLVANDILDCFDELITENMCKNHKPHPEPIEMALEKLGSKKENAVMIGDTIFDLLSSKNAGVKFALVEWSKDLDHTSLDEMEKPDYLLKNAEDIFKILEEN